MSWAICDGLAITSIDSSGFVVCYGTKVWETVPH